MSEVRLSAFPEGKDKRTYFSDVSLNHIDILNKQHTEMLFKKYKEAAQTVHQSGIPYYSAELFNFLEDAIYKIGLYLKTEMEHIYRPLFQEEMPSGEDWHKNTIWISSEEIINDDL